MTLFTSVLLLLLSASTITALTCYSCVKETEENGDIVQMTETCLDKSAATVCFPGQVCVEGNYESPFRKGRKRITEYFKGCDEPCTDEQSTEVCNEKWCDTDFCNDMLPEEIRTYVRGQEEEEEEDGTDMGIEEETEESRVEDGGEEQGDDTGTEVTVDVDEDTGEQTTDEGVEEGNVQDVNNDDGDVEGESGDDGEEVVENMDGENDETDESEGTEKSKEDSTSTINTTSEGEIDVEEPDEGNNGDGEDGGENIKDGENVDGGDKQNETEGGGKDNQVVDEEYVVEKEKTDKTPDNSAIPARLSDFLVLAVVLAEYKLSI